MFATIYLPNFYLQAALRHQSELCAKPVVLINDKDKKVVIIQLNQAAEKTGVHKGMTPSQGLARCLSLVIKTRAQSQEKLIDEILLHYAFTNWLNAKLARKPELLLCPMQVFSSRIWRVRFCKSRTQSNFSRRSRSKRCDIIADNGGRNTNLQSVRPAEFALRRTSACGEDVLPAQATCLCSNLSHGSAFDQKTINKTTERSAYKRPDPINIVVVPKICRHGRTKNARGIHSRAGKRSPKQDVESDCSSNDEAGDPPRPTLVNGRAMNHENEKER
ncbi:MAG: hypothetical protein E6L07_12260 [Verrucomicrobia bacterium]|nr:MAG: hypothetical protein E6L07_12260 [Verrucomicrobiota bacterium]